MKILVISSKKHQMLSNNQILLYFFIFIRYNTENGGSMKEKVISLIADKLGKKASQITLESKLVEDLGADSLDIVELIITFEDEFGISLPDEEVAKMKTIDDVVDYIQKQKK